MTPIDARLIALDAGTGWPCADFGVGGVVNLREGLRSAPFEPEEYQSTSPAAVITGRILVGSSVADNTRTDAASGEVRALDARTGNASGRLTRFRRSPRTRRVPAGAARKPIAREAPTSGR